jgi:GDP/UDP-N,N'-diacetylbacillosamine 2-epimerase (hydrolysing)
LSRIGLPTVMIYPNNDAGSALIRETTNSLRGPWLRVERNVSRELYGGLMRSAAVIVGNSSSALLEAPSFELPAVNIGRRQDGRVRALNVQDVAADEEAIACAVRRAISPAFRTSLRGMVNPYGDGKASQRIVGILADLQIDERLLLKKLTY